MELTKENEEARAVSGSRSTKLDFRIYRLKIASRTFGVNF